jgi:MFS superfamily sulfate permease-like transporter
LDQKTQLASLITAGLILLIILFLTGFFTILPNAVLGAVVIDAGLSLVKLKEFQHYRLSNRDFAAFLATALAVFFVVRTSTLTKVFSDSASKRRCLGTSAGTNV